jgi:hydroxymethylpyrimidine pyrophosphatase-like HAD family hydrolase
VNVNTGQLTLLADRAEPELLAALIAAGVPDLDVGHVVIGAPTSWRHRLEFATERTVGGRSSPTRAVALTPVGCDKASGLRAAIADLGLHHRPIMAIGDATNDLPMFAIATIAVGVANADDAVRASGVPLTTASFGLGVAEALLRFLPPAG